MLTKEANSNSELMARWDSVLYDSIMAALDLGFNILESAGLRHGLDRLRRMQSATKMRDIARQLSSAPTLSAAHRLEIGTRVALLSSSLVSLGERSICFVPPLQVAGHSF